MISYKQVIFEKIGEKIGKNLYFYKIGSDEGKPRENREERLWIQELKKPLKI